ncbi:zinc ribbon domain-containing protein [Modicisalibacter xianhensis]|uniref:zinc ribbon domain-containing protein n=1 Tax=Modicisalibacter xianhensis TaxID=442341 RepID=UPI003BF4AD67
MNGLRMRKWTCSECGVTHDHDINAGSNILAVGQGRSVKGIPGLQPGKDVKVLSCKKIPTS